MTSPGHAITLRRAKQLATMWNGRKATPAEAIRDLDRFGYYQDRDHSQIGAGTLIYEISFGRKQLLRIYLSTRDGWFAEQLH